VTSPELREMGESVQGETWNTAWAVLKGKKEERKKKRRRKQDSRVRKRQDKRKKNLVA